jgi:hypothetical protein
MPFTTRTQGWALLQDSLLFGLNLDLLGRHRIGSFNEPGELRTAHHGEYLCFPQGVVASHKLLGDGHEVHGRRQSWTTTLLDVSL